MSLESGSRDSQPRNPRPTLAWSRSRAIRERTNSQSSLLEIRKAVGWKSPGLGRPGFREKAGFVPPPCHYLAERILASAYSELEGPHDIKQGVGLCVA